MTDTTTNVRLDRLIEKLHASARIAIKIDRDRSEDRIYDRYDKLRGASSEYEKYLLTLDESTISAILDLSEGVGSVIVTTPVEIDNEAFKHVGLYYRGSDLLCGPPESANTDPLIRVPNGKHRFVLIAIPEVE